MGEMEMFLLTRPLAHAARRRGLANVIVAETSSS
jgi:hypothetical protein